MAFSATLLSISCTPVLEEAGEAVPVVVEVGQGLAERGLGRHARAELEAPFAQLLEHRCAVAQAHLVAHLGRLVADAPLDGIQGLDEAGRLEQAARLVRWFGRQLVRVDAQRLEPVEEVASGVREAEQALDGVGLHHRVVALVAVGVQVAGEVAEQARGHGAGARRMVVEQHDGPCARAADLAPQPGLVLRRAAGLIEHLRGGLVHVDVAAREHLIAQPS